MPLGGDHVGEIGLRVHVEGGLFVVLGLVGPLQPPADPLTVRGSGDEEGYLTGERRLVGDGGPFLEEPIHTRSETHRIPTLHEELGGPEIGEVRVVRSLPAVNVRDERSLVPDIADRDSELLRSAEGQVSDHLVRQGVVEQALPGRIVKCCSDGGVRTRKRGRW